jgi:biopolymer transport protein ExbD
MKLQAEDGPEEFVLNLTPMIDVVFLLLVFFMVATTFLDPERQLEVDLPVAETGAEPRVEQDEIVVHVRADGTVIYRDEELDHDELIDVLRGAAQRDVETPVTIRGHRDARHQAVVGVMDACGVAGLSNLSVGTTTEEQG